MNDQERRYTPNTKEFHIHLSDEQLNTPMHTQNDANRAANPGTLINGRVLPEDRAQTATDQKLEQQEIREHRKRNRVKARKNKRIFVFTWLVMIVLVSLTVASYLIGGSNDFLAVDRLKTQVTIEIPEEVTQEDLTDILYQAHAIEKPEFFSLYCMLTTKMEYFRSGTFTIDTDLDYEALINTLQASPDLGEEVHVTFPEGITVVRLAEILEENGLHTKDEYLEAFNSSDYNKYDFINRLGTGTGKYYLLEGYLFPDTYYFYENDTVEAILERFLDNFNNKMTDEMEQDIHDSGYTLDEIITMASIIQREAANTDDMYMISAILHNRLKNGEEYNIFSLDCDSTLYYPYSMSTAPEGYISNYSTYVGNGGVSGLPAGSICNPGLDAIMAAIYPSEEGASYYYFCHSGDGVPYYAATEEEHLQNLSAAGLL